MAVINSGFGGRRGASDSRLPPGQTLVDDWGGDAAALWTEGDPDGATVLKRLKALPGFGEQMRHVILPQAMRNSLPSLVNQFISTIKETSLGYIIGLAEVSFIATQINAMVFTKPAEVFGILGLTYFVLCFGLSRLAYGLERRLVRQGLGVKPVKVSA